MIRDLVIILYYWFFMLLLLFGLYSLSRKWMMMNVYHWWNENWLVKTKVLGEELVIVLVCRSQDRHSKFQKMNQACAVKSWLWLTLLAVTWPLDYKMGGCWNRLSFKGVCISVVWTTRFCYILLTKYVCDASLFLISP